MKKLVSIVIINWNGKHWLEKCLLSLRAIAYKPIEIIVVDNGSRDSSVEFLKAYYPEAVLIQNEKNLGFAEPNNQGYRRASGEYILLLNNDTEVKEGFLEILVERIESDESIGIVQPKIIPWEAREKVQVVGSYLLWSGFLYHHGWNKLENDFNKPEMIFSACGAAILIKREVIEKVGLFDGDYFAYVEETDFCWRVWLAGYTIWYEPRSVIYHKGAATSSLLAKPFVEYHSFKNRLCALLKNVGWRRLLVILPIHLSFCGAFIVLLLLKRKYEHARALLNSLGWNVKQLPLTLKKRSMVQTRMRTMSDRELFPLIMRHVRFPYYFHLAKGTLDQYNDDSP